MQRGASIFTKVVVLALAVYATLTLIDLYGQIENARTARIALEESVKEQMLENAVLEYEIENREDAEMIERIARGRLGLVMPGERTFYGVTN